ncbi:hypothetical protein BGX28_000652 [Mortierella sp. GBA30]|nr:hypothetical protein BGX28_000652 [Mortierella sp. GBA30]
MPGVPQENPTLLLECIQHILSYLQLNQLPTLCSLLTVNRTMFQLTLPILYQSPFVLVRDSRHWKDEEKTRRLVSLLRLFLSELDPALREMLPPSIIDDSDNEEEDWDSDYAKGPSPTCTAPVRGYFFHYRRHDHSVLAAYAIPRWFGAITRRQSQGILAHLDQAFLAHCGGRAISLCLDATRVNSFNSSITSLACLRRLEIHHIKEVTESSLGELVEWIRKHDSIHGTLRELQLGGLTAYVDDDDTNNQACLVQLPQAFKTLNVLETKSWQEAWTMIKEIPVEALYRLAMEYSDGVATPHGSDLLLRCKALKVLDVFVTAPDMFQGLADMVRTHSLPAQSSSTSYTTTIAYVGCDSNVLSIGGVPPIERLYLSGHHANLRNALEDATVGLSQTIRILKATSIERHNVLKPSLTWGGPGLDIQFPFLQELQLQGDIALEFHFILLRRCPNLQSLKLLVNGMESCQQADNPLEEILSLRRLQTLQLLGRWQLEMTFIQGIASNLTGLKILDLERCFGMDLDDVMQAVHTMSYLSRLGWDEDEVDDANEVVARWQKRAPRIRIGHVHWNEFYS